MTTPAKLLLFAAALLAGAAGPSKAGDQVDFHSQRPVIRGDTVYLTKQIHRQVWIPFSPEGPGWTGGDSIFQVFAVDFGRENSLRPVSSRVKEDPWNEFRFVKFDAKGRPGIRASSKLEAQLARVAGIGCGGRLSVDQQDSRVLYYQCRYEDLYYRFTESASFPVGVRPQVFRLGREFSYDGLAYYVNPFFSSGQDSKLYFRSLKGEFFELDLSQGAPRRIDPFAGFERGPEDAPADRIIGITPTLRVVDLTAEGGPFAFQALREGQPPRRYQFRDDSLSVKTRTRGMLPIYIADQNLVLWQIDEENPARTTVVALSLDTGEARRTSFRH